MKAAGRRSNGSTAKTRRMNRKNRSPKRFKSGKEMPEGKDGEKMQRSYEVMFIMRPDLTEEDSDKLISTLQTHATNAGAQIQNVEKMGKRRLAYDVRKFGEGTYVLLTLLADGKAIHELERR